MKITKSDQLIYNQPSSPLINSNILQPNNNSPILQQPYNNVSIPQFYNNFPAPYQQIPISPVNPIISPSNLSNYQSENIPTH